MIDLGKWASGKYVISTPINDPDDLDAIEYSGEQHKGAKLSGSKDNEERK